MKFEVYEDKASEWRWRLKANNGEIIASGQGYKNENDCRHCIGLIKSSSAADIVEVAD